LANSKEVLWFLPELTSLETVTLTTIDASGEWRLPGPNTFVKKMKIPWTGDDKINAMTFEDKYKDQWVKAKRGLAQQLLKAGGAYDLPTWTSKVFFQCCFFVDKREDIRIGTKHRQIIKLEIYQGEKEPAYKEIDQVLIDLKHFSGGQVVNMELTPAFSLERSMSMREKRRQEVLVRTESGLPTLEFQEWL
jgi:hypothetical protein